jgi:hypothetical protein
MAVPMKKANDQFLTIREVENGDATPTLASIDSSRSVSSRQAIQQESGSDKSSNTPPKEIVTFDEGPIPDGGYSWVVVVCQFISQMATWGIVSPYGVFISWFIGQNTYPGATSIQFGWIGGLFACVVFAMSPLSNYIGKLLPLRGLSRMY